MDKVEKIRSLLKEIDDLKEKRDKCDVIIANTDERFFSPFVNQFRKMKRAMYQQLLVDTLKRLNTAVMTG